MGLILGSAADEIRRHEAVAGRQTGVPSLVPRCAPHAAAGLACWPAFMHMQGRGGALAIDAGAHCSTTPPTQLVSGVRRRCKQPRGLASEPAPLFRPLRTEAFGAQRGAIVARRGLVARTAETKNIAHAHCHPSARPPGVRPLADAVDPNSPKAACDGLGSALLCEPGERGERLHPVWALWEADVTGVDDREVDDLRGPSSLALWAPDSLPSGRGGGAGAWRGGGRLAVSPRGWKADRHFVYGL